MTGVVAFLAVLVAVSVAIPIAVLFVECLAALTWRARGERPAADPVPRTVVLVPAHDEADWIAATLDTIAPDLREGDRVLVVAHNCTDSTAEVARARGADVVEANDDGTGGKPDALKAGLRALDDDPPDVVVVIDADCLAGAGAVARLADEAARTGGPVMGVYLFAPPEDGRAVQSISSLALLVKNHVRPLGLHRMGLPCLLNGSGSAYPFQPLRDVPHGEGSIAEDYQLTIDLLERGHPTRFVPDARVDSRLPTAERSALKQRRRWEHGHLYLTFRTAPVLILRGLLRLDVQRVALGLELLVPPLAFLSLAWAGSAALALVAVLWAGWGGAAAAAAWIAGASGALLFAGLTAAFVRFLGARETLSALVAIPGYVLWKIPLYLGFPARRETRWRKTER